MVYYSSNTTGSSSVCEKYDVRLCIDLLPPTPNYTQPGSELTSRAGEGGEGVEKCLQNLTSYFLHLEELPAVLDD